MRAFAGRLSAWLMESVLDRRTVLCGSAIARRQRAQVAWANSYERRDLAVSRHTQDDDVVTLTRQGPGPSQRGPVEHS